MANWSLQDTSQQCTSKEVDIRRGQNESRVLPAKLDTRRYHDLRCCSCDLSHQYVQYASNLLTFRQTSSLPMTVHISDQSTRGLCVQVTCLIILFLVTVSATSGRQITSWTTSSSSPQAFRHDLTPPKNHIEDQATRSEHLTTMVLPAKREARTGERRLWNE